MNQHRNTYEAPVNQRIRIGCYRCSAGCLHLEYGNLMLTFTQEQFLTLAEQVDTAHQQLRNERRAQETAEFDTPRHSTLVM